MLCAGAGAALASLAAFLPALNRRLYAIRREILLVVASFVITLVGLEGVVRWADLLGLSSLQEASRYHLDKVPDPVLVYKHRSGLHETYQGVAVITNELGLRDRPLQPQAEGEFRILVLGDSVAFGWGVAEEDTFARRLETKLAAALGSAVRTVNAGVGSYNTAIEHAFLDKYVDVISPDLVLLLYVLNDTERIVLPFDPWSARSFRGKSPPEMVNLILRRSWIYRLWLFTSGGFDDARNYDPHSTGVRESMAALGRIAKVCREKNIGFITFVFRSKQERDDGSGVILAEVSRVGAAHQFPTVDVAPWWADVEMRSVSNSVVDRHPNAQGHEILATGMAEALTKHGLIPGRHAQ